MNSTEEKTDFTIKQQWKRFLEQCGMKPGEMSEIQEREMKKAFYGSAGQTLLMIRDELTELDDEQAVIALENMLNEIVIFWREALADHEKNKEKG